MTDDTINYARDFTGHDEPRNSRGQTLPEYIDTLKETHRILKRDMLFNMTMQRKAKSVVEMRHYKGQVTSLSHRLATCTRWGREYGITLK
jgi:hypothetical protein